MFRPSLLKLAFIATLISSIFPLESAYCLSFDKVQRIMKNEEFRRARRLLIRQVKTPDRYDRAVVYMLLGICYYELGSRRGAVSSFKKAVRLDPDLSITPKDTKSLSIYRLYEKVKRSELSERPNNYRRARRSMGRKRGEDPGAMIVLPFGTPQFVQDKKLLGSTFAMAQALGIFLYYNGEQNAVAAEEEKQKVIAEQESAGYYEEDVYQNFLAESDDIIASNRQESSYGIYLFAGSYLLSIAEALINPATPSNTRLNRRRALLNAKGSLDSEEQLESIFISQVPIESNWNARVSPSKEGPTAVLEWSTKF